MTRVTPRTGGARALAVAALLVGALALFLVVRGDTAREYRLVMQNAGQLVRGDLVRIGGVQAGTVKSLELTSNGQAEVRVLLDRSWGRLHAGTTAMVRASGIATVTGRYVDISPGPSFRPALPDGGTIGIDRTTSIVDIDQLLNALDQPTRKSLSGLLDGFSQWYAGRDTQANSSSRYFAASLQSATRLFDEIGSDNKTLEEFLTQTSTALGAFTKRRGELTDLVSNTRATAAALASDQRSLSQALQSLPPALREGGNAFVDVRPALRDLRALVRAGDPASRELAPFLRNFRPVVSRAVPAFRDFRLTFDRPGKADDLYDALRLLPSLAKITDKAFPQAEKALADGAPVLSFIRPYTPELVGFARSFGSAAATYDANGHYARTVPIFDAFNFADNAQGGTLTPKASADRGTSPYLKTGQLRRCPGASLPTLSDASAPFVDSGDLAKPDCDPSEVIK